MKIAEILKESQTDNLKIVGDFVNQYKYNPQELDLAVKQLTANSKYTYSGSMYRFIMIGIGEIVNHPNIQYMTSKLQKYEQKYKREMFSWVPNIKVLDKTFSNNIHGEIYNTGYPAAFIIKQTGQGLDTSKLQIDHSYSQDEEHEILAPWLSNIEIAGFILNKTYDVSEFKEFVHDARYVWFNEFGDRDREENKYYHDNKSIQHNNS